MRNLLRMAPLACLVLAATSGLGQTVTTTGSITGTVTDNSGAVVPNASVTVTSVDTGVQTALTTNSDGVYTARFLPIGHYRVTVTAPGFKEQQVTPFSLEINQTVKLNTKLTVGGSNETVSVNADTAPILDTTDATLATTFTQNEIESLPLEGRNFASVTLFTPGVVNTDPTGMTGSNATERSTTSNNLISANGARGQANNFVVDGVEINEPQNNQIGYNVSPDSIQQMQVINSNAGAQYGNANGGNVVTVLKSGTNQFHGSAFGFLQSWKLNANSWSNKHFPAGQTVKKNHYTESFFGGTLGGPIIKNKLFFFGDYEGFRNPTGGISTQTVLTPAMLQGDFSILNQSNIQLYNTQGYNAATGTFPAYANNQVPVNNTVAKYLAAHPSLYPAPNTSGGTSGNPIAGNYRFPYSAGTQNDQFDVKVEYDPTTKDKFTGFYGQSRAKDDVGLRQSLPISFPGLNNFPSTLFGVTWIRTFSSAVVNAATVGFSRTNWSQGIPTDPSGQFGYNGNSLVGIPFGTQRYVGFSGQNFSAGGVGNPAAPQIIIDNTYSYTDNLTLQRGNHLFTVGVQASRYQQTYNQSQNGGGLGGFNYSGNFTANPSSTGGSGVGYAPADFIIDAVSSEALQNGGIFYNRQWRVAGYFEDDWKALPNLTLNLGLRYEYDEPMAEAQNRNANVLPLNFGTMEYAHAVPFGAPAGSVVCPNAGCYPANYRQIMPRLGFAYQPLPRISLRGGYGATSFFEGNAANQRLTNNPPLVSIFQRIASSPSATSGGNALLVSNGFSTSQSAFSPAGSSFSQWPQNIQPAYIQQFNLTLEGAISNKTSLSAGYVGQTGQHLMMYGNANQYTQAQIYDINTNYGGTTDATKVPASDRTPYYNLGAGTSYAASNGSTVFSTASRAASNYNAAQVTLRQRESYGLEYTVNYTFAKILTNAAGNYGTPNVSQTATFQDWYNGAADYGPGGFDIRHNVSAIVVYALPYGHGRTFGGDANRFLDETLGGWRVSNAFIAYSGIPVTMTSSFGSNVNSYGAGNGQLRANQYGHMKIRNRSILNWWGTDPSAVPCQTIGSVTSTSTGSCAYGNTGSYQFGTARQGTERAPGYYNLDSSLFKDFRTFESQTLSLRVDAFNVLNVAAYGNPGNNVGSYTTDPSTNGWGLIGGVRNQERRFQLALNYKF